MKPLSAIITGDIVNSSAFRKKVWMSILVNQLEEFGQSPADWEIYRGDSFQLHISADQALTCAIILRASLKTLQGCDARMAIGVGEVNLTQQKLSMNDGPAFLASGHTFDTLSDKKIQIAGISTHKTLNLMLDIMELVISRWTINDAIIIREGLLNPEKTQIEIAKKLNKSQSNLSKSFAKAGYEELKALLLYYKDQVTQ